VNNFSLICNNNRSIKTFIITDKFYFFTLRCKNSIIFISVKLHNCSIVCKFNYLFTIHTVPMCLSLFDIYILSNYRNNFNGILHKISTLFLCNLHKVLSALLCSVSARLAVRDGVALPCDSVLTRVGESVRVCRAIFCGG
jgi:hypothetical protein